MGLLLVLVLLDAQAMPGRIYHPVPLAKVATTSWVHVCTSGTVVYMRRMRDGDVHVTLIDPAGVKLVAEIIPLIPLPAPKKGAMVEVCGITRWDKRHKWAEVHPVEMIRVLPKE